MYYIGKWYNKTKFYSTFVTNIDTLIQEEDSKTKGGFLEMRENLKKGITKRILSFVLMLAMVLTLMPSVAMEVEAATASSGYTTDEHGLMEHRLMGDNVYDFMGYINSGWKQVTFANNGFSIGVYNGSGLSVTSSPSFIADGKAIMVTYTVRNTGSQPVSNCRFFIAADTMIDGNDASTNAIEDDVVVMTNERTGVSFFALSSTEGGTAVATEYNSAEVSYGAVRRGADPSTVTSVASARDSAFVMYFPRETIAAGGQKQYTLVVGMGDARSIGSIIGQVKNSLNAALDYASETLKDLEPGGSYEIRIEGDASGTAYSFIASQAGTIPLVGKDKNNKDYNFIGKKVVIVHKGNGVDTQDSDSVVVHVAGRPEPTELEVPINMPSDININDVVTTTNSIKVVAAEGQEYRIGTNGSWVSPGADGCVTFSGLNQLTEYTIYTRVKATSSAPASLISDGAVVKTWGMFAPTKIEYNGPFDRIFHELKVNANVEGANVTYSQNLEGPYTSETFSFKTSGEHRVYYCITKENYYNAYGILTANINYNLAAAKEAAKETIDAEAGADTSTRVKEAVRATKAAIDAATTLEGVEEAVGEGFATINAARAADVLAAEKAAAKDIIDAEVDGDTSRNVIEAANAVKAAIDAATTSAAVVEATSRGINAINAVKEANALNEAKNKAKADIDIEVDGDTSENVKQAANEVKEAIDTATTLEEVAKATGDGIEAIMIAKATNALAAAKVKAKADVEATVVSGASQDIQDALAVAKEKIDAATTLEEVAEETYKGIAAVAEGEVALEAARQAAKDIIDAEVGGDTSENVVAEVIKAKNAIDNAAFEDVLSVADAGIAAIRDAKIANALEIAKKAAKEIINAEVAGDTSESVVTAASGAIDAIIAATTTDAVVTAADVGIEAIRAAKLANELAAAKKAAEADIDAEVGADMAENVAELIRKSKEAINAATTLEDIAKETARAMEAIEVMQEANALVAIKKSTKAEIDAEVGTDTSANVISAAKAAKEAIDAATTPAAVLAATARGIEAINAAKAQNEPVALHMPDTAVTTTTVTIADANEIINITPLVKENAFSAVLDSANLKDAIELTQFEKDCGVWVWVEVDDVTPTVDPADEQVIIANVKDATIGAYINIDLFKQVAGQEKTKIAETAETIKLSVTIPDSIAAADRVYAIVRVHDGVYEQITDFTQMKDGNVVEFASDRFSTYAIIYKEATAKDAARAPKTGDVNMAWAYMLMLLGVAFIVGATIYRKKRF